MGGDVVEGGVIAGVGFAVSGGLCVGDGVMGGRMADAGFRWHFFTLIRHLYFVCFTFAVTIADPAFFAVTRPFLFTLAIRLSEEPHLILPRIPGCLSRRLLPAASVIFFGRIFAEAIRLSAVCTNDAAKIRNVVPKASKRFRVVFIVIILS